MWEYQQRYPERFNDFLGTLFPSSPLKSHPGRVTELAQIEEQGPLNILKSSVFLQGGNWPEICWQKDFNFLHV